MIQYLAENFDKRLLYFTSVYLTSKKYIDFITLLPEPIVIKIISNIDPGIGLASGLTSGQKYQFPANFRFRVFFSHADSDVKIHWNELEKFQKKVDVYSMHAQPLITNDPRPKPKQKTNY